GLVGALEGGTVFVLCTPDVVNVLDVLCLGTLDGAEQAAKALRDKFRGAGEPGSAVEALSQGAPVAEATHVVRLSCEEAFFVSYAVEALAVVDWGEAGGDQARVLGSEDLWKRLLEARSDFPVLYLAYHHFRSKYGADFVVYHRHPAVAHSDYTSIVLPLLPPEEEARRQEGALSDKVYLRPPPEVHSIQIASRLSAQVSKRLMLLYLRIPSAEALLSPACLTLCQAEERLMRRWVPESHRGV
ncbi:hypothetical protein H632_c1677p1, partial [Helicosporidium sp. ATCC 50920]